MNHVHHLAPFQRARQRGHWDRGAAEKASRGNTHIPLELHLVTLALQATVTAFIARRLGLVAFAVAPLACRAPIARAGGHGRLMSNEHAAGVSIQLQRQVYGWSDLVLSGSQSRPKGTYLSCVGSQTRVRHLARSIDEHIMQIKSVTQLPKYPLECASLIRRDQPTCRGL